MDCGRECAYTCRPLAYGVAIADIVAYHRAGVADAVRFATCAAVADKHEAAVVVVAVVIFYVCIGAVVVAVKSLGIPRCLVV